MADDEWAEEHAKINAEILAESSRDERPPLLTEKEREWLVHAIAGRDYGWPDDEYVQKLIVLNDWLAGLAARSEKESQDDGH